MVNDNQYLAFISYKREDEKWAKWLQKKIEGYRLPARLCKQHRLPPRLPKVFLDTTDIQPGPLSETLEHNLKNSRFLIVICSNRSAGSYWVGEEIQYFIKTGGKDRIILFIVDGIPYSGDPQTECIHPVIRKNLPEMLGVNVREASKDPNTIKRQKAFIRLLATLLDISFDSLWNRYRRRIIKRAVSYVFTAILFIICLGYTWHINQPCKMQVQLKEMTPYNKRLPFPKSGAAVILSIEGQQLRDTFFHQCDTLLFSNIPSSLKHKKVSINMHAIGFFPIDTSIIPDKKFAIPLSRDETYFGIVQGIIRNSKDDKVIPGAEVEIQKNTAKTNAYGEFRLMIPLALQDTAYQAKIRYKNKEYFGKRVFPMQHNDKIRNAIYLE